MTGEHRSVMEFHAHTRELRHAMKHNLYSPEDMQGKLAKVNKYAAKTKEDFPEFTHSVDKQLQRIQNGHKPKNHSVQYWTKKLGI